jgi:hypothetical protein
VIKTPIKPISEKSSSEDLDADDRSDKVGKIFESSIEESEIDEEEKELAADFLLAERMKQELIDRANKSAALTTLSENNQEPDQVVTAYKEVPYLYGELVKISDDVYGMTIGANIMNEQFPGTIGPTEYIFCLRQCAFVFVLQCCLAGGFAMDELTNPQYPVDIFNWPNSIIRIIAGTLLQIQLNKELKGAMAIMMYLKQQEVTPRNQTSRYINLMLCFMQCSTPILVQIMFTV